MCPRVCELQLTVTPQWSAAAAAGLSVGQLVIPVELKIATHDSSSCAGVSVVTGSTDSSCPDSSTTSTSQPVDGINNDKTTSQAITSNYENEHIKLVKSTCFYCMFKTRKSTKISTIL